MFRKAVLAPAYRLTWKILKRMKKIKTKSKTVGESPIVRVQQGELKGRCFVTKGGAKINSYQGVPYAKPPVGNLRFQAPEPAEPWDGILDATREGNDCSQIDGFLSILKVPCSEDCLYMNVYTPADPSPEPYPVMVWVHGGAFTMLSGSTDLLGPDLLVEQGIILVTFNYRLGPLGFLSLDTDKLPGNAGLKDQVAALRWVRDNISAFGGDPNNVTLAGESAGGASVHYHMVSDSSKGLFHKAISQSGSALNPWALQDNPRERALSMCAELGHPTTDLDDAFQFLQSAPVMDLVKAQVKILTPEDKRCRLGMLMVPSIENEYPGIEPFITESVLERYINGKFHNVPYITGYNSAEGAIFVQPAKKKVLTNLDRDFERIIPNFIDVEAESEECKDVANKIRKYYFSCDPITKASMKEYCRLTGDLQFVYGIYKTAKIQSTLSSAPTWMYKLSYDDFSLFKLIFRIDVPGVSHGDDLMYLFQMDLVPIALPKTLAFKNTTRRFVKMWTDFVKTSDPTPEINDLIPIRWEPVTKDTLNFLEIGKELSMEQNPEAEQMAFWEELVRSTQKRSCTNDSLRS